MNYLTDSQIEYVQRQIARMRSGHYDENDCLYRIGSSIDLIRVGEEITDSTRDRLLQWIEEFEQQQRYQFKNIPALVWESLNSQTPIELFVAAPILLLMGFVLPWVLRVLAAIAFPAITAWTGFLLSLAVLKMARGFWFVSESKTQS